MRTTIRLDDQLLRDAKKAAVESGRTLTSLIEDALRLALTVRGSVEPIEELPVFHGSGLRPGVDLADSAGLEAIMNEEP
jgi:hypothetical protein